MTPAEPTLEDSRNQRAHAAAQAAYQRVETAPTGVVRYESRGRVLVIGGTVAQWCAVRLQPPLHAAVLLTEDSEEAGVPTTVLGGRPLRVSGTFGAFRVELGERGRHDFELLQADLLIDFGVVPLFTSDIPPPGYWRFGREPQDIDTACATVDGMVGVFEKPRYFAYDPDLCAHMRSGQSGCRSCIDACPAEAIHSIAERVEVDPQLCQGGGICASVCPSGAMRYAYPGPADTAERVRAMLQAYLGAGGTNPIVVFVAQADAGDLTPAPHHLVVPLEELASIGHEIWLATLAWGARAVLLANGGSLPPRARVALERQILFTHDLLRGLGYEADALRLVATRAVTGDEVAAEGPPPARFTATAAKRQLAELALDHLWQHSRVRPQTIVILPGAPYGRIHVDSSRCTLCMSCTSVCPAHALSAGDDVPRLVMHEVNCIQCGICANSCPEKVITLEARYLADPAIRREPSVLFEEQPFCCVSCGKPFATQRVIGNMLVRLAGHAMFQSERARRRLQMCEDCRVVDVVQDAEAMQGAALGPGQAHPNKGRA